MKAFIWTIVCLITLSSTALAQSDDIRRKNFNIKKGVAIEGFDPVSYFDNKPLEGAMDLQFVHKGVAYLFATASNLLKFKASPDKYEPAYGGWCSYAMGNSGEKVKIEPQTFKIIDGKLHLFYNFRGNNSLDGWNKNEKELHSKGDQNWKKFIP